MNHARNAFWEGKGSLPCVFEMSVAKVSTNKVCDRQVILFYVGNEMGVSLEIW